MLMSALIGQPFHTNAILEKLIAGWLSRELATRRVWKWLSVHIWDRQIDWVANVCINTQCNFLSYLESFRDTMDVHHSLNDQVNSLLEVSST